MKPAWINLLCDPVDGTKLKLINPSIKNGRIVSGKLLGKTGNIYKIKNGIPILLPKSAQSVDSVNSFAFEWDEWGYPSPKKIWLETMKPILGTETKFKGKVAVDAGAGSGAHSRWMAEAGAKLVISLELSDTIFNRHKEMIKGFEDVIFPIQCDIAYPPITVKPDIILCINVLQHTKNPKNTFKNLTTLMHKKSIFLFNVYNKDSILGSKIVRVFRQVVRWFPFRIWKYLSFLIAFGIFAAFKIAPWVIKSINSKVNFSSDFQGLWLKIYDVFGAHYYQFPFSQKEQLEMFKESHLRVKLRDDFGYLLVKST